jgi:hypothetical protein
VPIRYGASFGGSILDLSKARESRHCAVRQVTPFSLKAAIEGRMLAMLSPDQKELFQVFTPVLSALVGISAVVVAVRLGALQRRIQEGQRKIQEGQLKIQEGQLMHALFDKRFAAYEASERFLVHIMQKNGAIETLDLQAFVGEVEKAEFLFGSEVAAYMKELQTKAGEVYVKSCDASTR